MKLYDVSQLPVLQASKVVGILDEEDILLQVFDDDERFQRPVAEAMSTKVTTVAPSAPVASLMPIFKRGMVVIVEENGQFLGLITRIDLLNYLRRRAR
jgi:cystathionine beta-synthase